MQHVEYANREVLKAMFRLQDSLNSLIYPDWRERGLPWRRAIWTECAELVEHLGWKWWKSRPAVTDETVTQARLEIIDIWHFTMSAVMARGLSPEVAAAACPGVMSADSEWRPDALVTAAEDLARTALAGSGEDVVTGFWRLAGRAGMTVSTVQALYVPKNVLNIFRQRHGYKTGTYEKNWGGQEDNVHLAEIWEALGREATPERLMARLSERYSLLVREKQRLTAESVRGQSASTQPSAQ